MTTSGCEIVEEQLALYLDGELEAAGAKALEQHLQSCDACSATLVQLRELSAALRAQTGYHRAPDGLRKRLLAQQPLAPRKARPDWQRWLLSLAASLAVAIGIDWQLAAQRNSNLLADEIVAAHVRSLMASHLADVASSDRHTVKPWFAGKLDYSPLVRDLASQGFPLTGGRLDYIERRSVAALVYQHRQHQINLFIWPAGSARISSPRAETRAGYNLLHWTTGGMECWAVSDLNAAELRSFADDLSAPTQD